MKPKYFMHRLLAVLFVVFKPAVNAFVWFQSPRYYRFYSLNDKIRRSYRKKEYTKAESLAVEYLALAKRFRRDWNYGNAIHDGHMVLGLIRLHENDIIEAKKHFLASGRTHGSPQLNSFGPSKDLARGLLERGEKDVVLKYLDLIGKFWLKDDQPEFHELKVRDQVLMNQWKTDVNQGRIPEQWG